MIKKVGIAAIGVVLLGVGARIGADYIQRTRTTGTEIIRARTCLVKCPRCSDMIRCHCIMDPKTGRIELHPACQYRNGRTYDTLRGKDDSAFYDAVHSANRRGSEADITAEPTRPGYSNEHGQLQLEDVEQVEEPHSRPGNKTNFRSTAGGLKEY